MHLSSDHETRPGGLLRLLGASLLTLAFAASAPAQLGPEDIEALRLRGQQEGWTFTVGRNPATRYSLEQLCGVVEPEGWREGAPFDPCTPRGPLPDYFDWRDHGGCTPIKDQDGCGSCWAFALNGSFESAILIKDGLTRDLSEQWLVSCTGVGGCSGAWPGDACNYYLCSGAYKDPCGGFGAVLEEDFPYLAWDAPCNCPYDHAYCVDSYAFIGPEWGVPSVGAIKQAILDYGPVTVCVYVNSSFSAYTGGIFNDCQDVAINHAIDLVGWDDNQGSEGVWFLRNSWGEDWGEDGYMRIEYECSRIGYNGMYIYYEGTAPKLGFDYPQGRPEFLDPGQPTTFPVHVLADTGTPVPGTGRIHYALNGGVFVTEDLTQIEPNQYEATLPAAECFDRYDWYVTAEEETSGTKYDPKLAPTVTYSAVVATGQQVIFEDDFQTDQGWTVYAGADKGDWERADPEEVTTGDWWDPVISQPENDHTPSGTLCYVTGAAAGSSAGTYDVDGGPTRLTSPVFDLAGGDATVSYWRWFHISTEWDDELLVEVSNDGGSSWVVAESVSDRETWTEVSWKVSDFVTPTDEVRVRFTADDSPNNSLVEALVDDFSVTALVCEPPTGDGDCDHDGDVDLVDFGVFQECFGLEGLPAACQPGDLDGSGHLDLADLALFAAALTGP